MIKVTFYKDEDNNIKRYMVKGHANFDEYGKDIVCAAASILTQNTLISLVELLELEESIDYDIRDGKMDVRLLENISQEAEEGAQLLLSSLELGLRSIAEQYPKNMTLQYKGV